MLFKRVIEGKSMLNKKSDAGSKTDKCSRRRSECDGCWEHSTILEEMAKMVLLGVMLWAGVTFGGLIAPYPLNLILTTDSSLIHPPPQYDFPFPSAEMLKRLPHVTEITTNRSLEYGAQIVNMLAQREHVLAGYQMTPTPGTAGKALTIGGRPSEDAMHYFKSSLIVAKASENMVYRQCLLYHIDMANDVCAGFISTINLRNTEYGQECAALQRPTCRANKMSSKYRSFDGACNNPVMSSWGRALSGYKRLLHPKYSNGIDEEKSPIITSHELPSARLISTKLVDNVDRPNNKKTIALAVWSEFVHHDLAHTPVRKAIHTNKAIRCCTSENLKPAPRYVHPSCMSISVPEDDPVHKYYYSTCMEYTRSVTTYRGDCTFGASEQMNQATHFLDGSHIYGTNSREAAALRERSGGLLRTTTFDGEELPPFDPKATESCLVTSDADACFITGDARANSHPWMAGLHSIWVREHNRIARALATLNPAWGSDRLYHEARRIVVAELQHITYKQWLPALTGKSFEDLYESHDASYNSDTDPTVTNAFATAAFEFINSILDKDIELVDGETVTSERLKNHYYKPSLVAKKGGLVKIMKGMVNQKAQEMDMNYDEDLHHYWLGRLDALAIAIQRGRDHGLPGYPQYRALCGLPQVSSFQQLADVIPQETLDKLPSLYDSPADIDLVVGMMAESPLPGSLLGPTATCFLKDQLWRTRVGDRYFYTHADEAGSFTKRQLAELKRASLARVLCDNGGVRAVQRDVFQPASESNPTVPCEDIKKVSLEAFQDAAQQPDIFARTNKWLKNKVSNSGNATK